jgi:hypothetical protein
MTAENPPLLKISNSKKHILKKKTFVKEAQQSKESLFLSSEKIKNDST